MPKKSKENKAEDGAFLRESFLSTYEKFMLPEAEVDSDILFEQLSGKYKRMSNSESSGSLEQQEEIHDKMAAARAVLARRNRGEATAVASGKKARKLPECGLMAYDLTHRTWIPFWAQFRKVYEAEDIDSDDKFQYLLQSLQPETKARKIVEGIPACGDNLMKAVEELKRRFGKDKAIIEVFTRDLLSLVLSQEKLPLWSLCDNLKAKLNSLEVLGVTSDKYEAILLPLVENCLPMEVLKAWERFRRVNRVGNRQERSGSTSSLENLDCTDGLTLLMDFLDGEVEGLERLDEVTDFKKVTRATSVTKSKVSPEPRPVTAAALHVTGKPSLTPQSNRPCIFCNSVQHKSKECPTAMQWTTEERSQKVREANVCFRCLFGGHRSKFCKVKTVCEKCSERHVTIMCRMVQQPDPALHAGNIDCTIYLKTLMVKVGKVEARALLDDGCSRSYITKGLAKRLGLQASGTEVTSHTLFGGVNTEMMVHNIYDVELRSRTHDFACSIQVLEQESICCSLPRVTDPVLLNKLKQRGVTLSDLGPNPPGIDILLGSQALGSLLTGRIEVLGCGVSAIETKLGWSVLGAVRKKKAQHTVNYCMLNADVPKLWELESIGIENMAPQLKNGSDESYAQFEHTLKVNSEGRYEVALPWLEGHPPLNQNRDIAEIRLHSTTRRLEKQHKFSDYDNVFQSWIKDDIVEPVLDAESGTNVHYLPHRPVFKEHASKSKVRPVFDASAKKSGGVSLNECLAAGTNLFEEITAVLSRFRVGAIGVTADIKQAFLMIAVQKEDRDALRFLWWNEGKVTEYRHTRVVFGVTSSPFLLHATLAHHLRQERFACSRLADTTLKLQSSFYCDDCVTSVESTEELVVFIEQAKEILLERKFELRGWVHSSKDLDPEVGDDETVHNVLGLKWDVKSDVLFCSKTGLSLVESVPLTKRGILSVVSRVFDPCGFLCPALLLPKLLLQEAWKLHLEWDEELPADLQRRFKLWLSQLETLESVVVPRRMHHGPPSLECCQLHVFCDASGLAYACCAYLRCEYGGEVEIQLVAAKSRVGPMEKYTIPRMELLAAIIGMRLANSIYRGLKVELKTTFWTDSMIVLAWITNEAIPWKTWVGNRVTEIRKGSHISSWRHVPGEMNVADTPSRGCAFSSVQEWLKGPCWLKEAEDSWPSKHVETPTEALLEKRPVVAMVTVDEPPFSDSFLRFSSYSKIVRIVAYMLRFVWNSVISNQKRVGVIKAQEFAAAELAIFRIVQAEWLPEDRKKCATSVEMFQDSSGLWRIKTKLLLSDDHDDFKTPVVLQDHPLVRKLIQHQHQISHTGVQTTLSVLREQVWILRGRQVVRQVIRACQVCKRYSVKNCEPAAAPLPPRRTGLGKCFDVTGVDLAGPLFLKNGEKAWIVLYTCAVYRAVHLELVGSLSTEAFLMSLRRFIARRGRPSCLVSDNGGNLRGADALMRGLDWTQIEAQCALQRIKWVFNPPAAPWHGGFWERLIRVVKDLLRKNLGKASLTYEETCTLLCSCEQEVNRRPLTYQYDEANELRPLTPANFLGDLPNKGTDDVDEVDRGSLLNRVRYRQEIRDRLISRFRDEYLGSLVGRPKGERGDIEIGDIVLIGVDSIKRTLWPLGRVLEVYPGKDGVTRVAKVRVAQGELVRPVQRLYPLEIRTTSEVSDITDVDNELLVSAPPSPLTVQPVRTPSPVAAPQSPQILTSKGRWVKPPIKLDL